MAAAAIGAAAASTVFEVYANNKEAKAQQAAANEAADAKKQQARDLMQRFELNSQEMRKEGEIFKSKQISAYAKSGVDVTTGSTLLALEETQDQITSQIGIERMQAKAEENALLTGAQLDINTGNRIREINKYRNIATVLGGASKAASSYKGK